MAPRKPITKSLEGDSANEVILQYLKAQNRPYSATDVSSNLHNKVNKTKTDKALKEMFERGEIGGRASGKQWVYWCLQDAADSASPADLAAMDQAITNLRNSLPALKATLKSKHADLAAIRSAPATALLQEDVAALSAKKAELKERLSPLRNGSVPPVSKTEMEAVAAEVKKWEKKARERKRMFRDIEGLLLEGMRRDELWEKLGIEDDPAE